MTKLIFTSFTIFTVGMMFIQIHVFRDSSSPKYFINKITAPHLNIRYQNTLLHALRIISPNIRYQNTLLYALHIIHLNIRYQNTILYALHIISLNIRYQNTLLHALRIISPNIR